MAFREHDLIGGHRLFALRDAVKVEVDPDPAFAGDLGRGRGQSRRAHILDRLDGVGLHQLQASFNQQFFDEGVADLHARALIGIGLREFGRSHGRAMNAVAPGFRADIKDHRARLGAARIENPVLPGKADAHRIDEDIAVIAFMKIGLSANGRHADAIAIAAYAGDNAAHQALGARMGRIAKAQGVEQRDRPRSHREHIAHDAADPGRCALGRFDKARVIVALHFEHASEPIANIDDAGILARALDDARPAGRQRL